MSFVKVEICLPLDTLQEQKFRIKKKLVKILKHDDYTLSTKMNRLGASNVWRRTADEMIAWLVTRFKFFCFISKQLEKNWESLQLLWPFKKDFVSIKWRHRQFCAWRLKNLSEKTLVLVGRSHTIYKSLSLHL